MKGAQSKGGKTIRGEVLRVEGENYFIREGDGKEVRWHTEQKHSNNENHPAG